MLLNWLHSSTIVYILTHDKEFSMMFNDLFQCKQNIVLIILSTHFVRTGKNAAFTLKWVEKIGRSGNAQKMHILLHQHVHFVFIKEKESEITDYL